MTKIFNMENTEDKDILEKWSIHQIVQDAISKAHTSPSPETSKVLEEIKKTMDDNYSKRELDEHFENVKKQFEGQNKLLYDLNIKVGIQNGSVGNLKAWRTGISMAIAVIAFIVIPLIVYSFQLSQENLKNSILLELKNDQR